MSLPFRSLMVVIVAICAATSRAASPTSQPQPLVLHIAADPNNLPFSNDRLEGFENKIAALIASDLGATIDYTWWAQRRGFFRDTVKHGSAEVVMGVPAADFERVIPTRPYYRSTYVFVYRKDRNLNVHSFDDPELKNLKIGVPLVGGSASSPPAAALAERGVLQNIVGYSLYADYREPNPNSRIVRDVADGKIDVAIVWGPVGGYFARSSQIPLEVVPVPQPADASTRFAYDIAIGVKRSNPALRQQIDQILLRRHAEIDRILDDYSVPRAPATQPAAGAQAETTKTSAQASHVRVANN